MDGSVAMITVWDKKDIDDTGYFFSFSKDEKNGLLYLRNFEKYEEIILPEELFRLEYIAGKNIGSANRIKDKFLMHVENQRRTASALFLITSLAAKKPISPSLCDDSVNKTEWGAYLKESDDLDFLSAPVREVTEKILRGFSSYDKQNLYWKANNAFSWTRKNISYSILPAQAVERMKETICALPKKYKRDVSIILKSSFPNLPPEELTVLASQITIPLEIKDPREQARHITAQFGAQWKIFLCEWDGLKKRSASATITDRVGKCDCISNVFVALCRSMGIPAMVLLGYLQGEGRHAWAAVYIPPYGWIETDPTNKRLLSHFDNEKYLYEFLRENFKGEKYILPIKDSLKKDWLQRCKTFYKKANYHPAIEEISAVISAN